MSVQIESGYYALVPQSAYSSIEDLPGGSDVTERLLTELGKSPTGCAIQDHATIAGLFWVWKMMDSGWVLLMFAMPYLLVGTLGFLWYRNRKNYDQESN